MTKERMELCTNRLINSKLKNGKKVQQTADREKSFKDTKVHTGLSCHERRRRRRRKRRRRRGRRGEEKCLFLSG
jgi:hypothetical protein